MWVTALERKLGRELLQLKGQILTIALVVASGIMSFAALRGTYESLEASRSHYYADRRFADVFAFAKRVPSSVARRVEALPGVATVETRVTGEITLPIEGLARPAYGRLLSLPSGREPATNAPHLRRGRWPERSASEEVVVLEPSPRLTGWRAWAALGDGYHVEARLVLWRGEQVLQVPALSVFRHGEGSAVFAIENDRARLVPITTGHRGDVEVEVVSGLSVGDSVIEHPGDRVKDGVKVERVE